MCWTYRKCSKYKMVHFSTTTLFLATIALSVTKSYQTFQSVGQEFEFLNVDKVWEEQITGKGVVVAVVDDAANFQHTDLSRNYISRLSKNFIKSGQNLSTTSHGIRCAGLIAAKKDGECRTGIAYDASIVALRTINGPIANQEATSDALKHKRNEIDIYSNSWGIIDNGWAVTGPGPLVKNAFEEGVKKGRNGLGSIFVFASGNGGFVTDSCAFDGYINNIHTVAIGAITKSYKVPRYAESCSSVIAATYGGDMRTSDVKGCDSEFGKTSAAAAIGSGIIALLLEANNKLTWRDVQHLIIRTSNPRRDITDGKGWIVNGAGLLVHPALGFGVMDAKKLVDVARNSWKKVPEQKSCTIQFTEEQVFHRAKPFFTIDSTTARECSGINNIEHVQVQVSLTFPKRGLLEMYLESPHKTKSQLVYKRIPDAMTKKNVFKDLVVTSLHFWGENVSVNGGKWTLSFKSASFRHGVTGKLSDFKITFYGTEQDPNYGASKGSVLHGNSSVATTSAQAVEAVLNCDDEMDLYVDGIKIGKDNGKWDKSTNYTFPANSKVVAIHGYNGYGIGGIIGSFSTGLVTDTSWRCTYRTFPNWQFHEFDDSAWPGAVVVRRSRNIKGPKIAPEAEWIWIEGMKMYQNIYCRKVLGKQKPRLTNITENKDDMITCLFGTHKRSFWSGYGSHCCGNMGVYDKNHAMCCSGKIITTHGSSSMCGNTKYDKCNQICCDGNIHPKIGEITRCCGKLSYNINSQSCCNKIVVSKYDCKKIYCAKWQFSSVHYYKHTAVCVGNSNHLEYWPNKPFETCSDCKDKDRVSDCLSWKRG